MGGLTAHALPMTRSPEAELFIYDLAVRADRQRRGIGRTLVLATLDRAKAVAQVLQDDGVPQGSIAVEAAPRHNDDVTARAEIFLEP